MITAKSAQELARKEAPGVTDLVNQSLFYIEQYVAAAAGQKLTQIEYILGDELRQRDDASAALTKKLEELEFTVTREENVLVIAWGA